MRATALSLNACPYLATLVLHRRPRSWIYGGDNYSDAGGVGSDGVNIDTRPGSVYVQAGDSLSRIAARFSEYGNVNDLKNQLIAANPQLRDPNALTEGLELNFPGAGTVVDKAAMARAVGADGRYQAALAAQQPDAQEPVWSFRDASMAQRKLDDARALAEYQAKLANGPVMSAAGPSARENLLATASTIDSIASNPFGAAGYLIGRAFGSERDGAAMASVGAVAGDLLALRGARVRGGNVGLVESEAEALRRIAENNRAGSPWADLRRAYQQAQGQVDFAHIEADVSFKANGQVKAQGGHFSTSPQLQRVPGTETVSPNGVIYGQVNLLGPDGNFYQKTNNGGFSSMTPDSWSLAQAKAEMSQAWLNRALSPAGGWTGVSGGVEFVFHAPNSKVPQWRGYPVKP